MKITIDISKKDKEHLENHRFYDCCGVIEDIMLQIQEKLFSKKDQNTKGRKR